MTIKRTSALSPGDEIEYSLSQEVPYPKGASTWVKYGCKTTVRAGETATAARKRLQDHVEAVLDTKISELIST